MALARQKYWHIRTNLTRPLLYNYNLNSNYKDYSKNLLASLTCLVFLQSLSLVVAERRYLGFYAEVFNSVSACMYVRANTPTAIITKQCSGGASHQRRPAPLFLLMPSVVKC